MKFFAPGRVNLIGEHIDYNGGNVFPAAISMGTFAEVNLRDDKIITLFSKNFVEDGIISINLEEKMTKIGKWSDFVSGVIVELRAMGLSITQGADIIIEGTIPNGSGLSSSASLEVLFVKIFSTINNFTISDKDTALVSQAAENNFIGVNCGIMDQFIIANGQKDMALNLNCNTLDFELVPLVLGDYSLIIMDTKKRRELAESAYNVRREQCDNGLVILKKHYEVEEICDLTIEQIEAVKGEFEEIIYKRLYHAVSEQDRVLKSVDFLKNGQIEDFCELINQSHYSLRDNYEVSCMELDCFVDLVIKHGALGARMTGAGFGGCAIAIVPTSKLEDIKEKATKEYREITGLKGLIYTADISDKVHQYE